MSTSTSNAALGTTALTSKQTEELNKAILSYLESSGYTDVASLFSEKANIKSDTSSKDALTRKWRSVVRLQKKVSDLESEVAELRSRSVARSSTALSSKCELPRATASMTLYGHRRMVTCVCFHPLYQTLISCSDDGTIRIWDTTTGKTQKVLQGGHSDSVTYCAFSPSGSYLASCSNDLSIKLWSVEDGYQCIKTLQGHDHTVSAVKFINDDFAMSISRDSTVKLWDLSTGFCIKTLQGHEGWVKCIDVTETDANNLSGVIAVTGGADEQLLVWDVIKGSSQSLLGHEHVVQTVALSNVNAEKALCAATNLPHHEVTRYRYAVSGSRDKTVKVWDLQTLQCVHTITHHDNWISAVKFHPCGQYIITASDDKTIRVFDITKQFKEVRRITTSHFVSCFDYLVEPATLAVATADHNIKLYICEDPVDLLIRS